jgi:copper chaperone CopZ
MKSSSFFVSRVALAALVLLSTVALLSWDRHQAPGHQQQTPGKDTIPQQRERKVRDLDEALSELDNIDLQVHIEKAMASVAEAMKELDGQKLQLIAQKALQEVDMEKVKADMDKAMKEIDFEKIQAEVKESMEKVNWDEIKAEMEKVRKIDFVEIDKELKRAQEQIKNIQPQIEKGLADAKVQIEKAKVEIREYKNFVDGLEKNGLLNKKENYSIRHKDGKLTVNGKEVSPEIYNKYKSFLDNHKKLHIEKENDSFDMDDDNDNDII